MNTFYRGLRGLIALLLRTFYVIEPPLDPAGCLKSEGPVMFVGNHPNGMVDPALVFVLAQRHITFLAKAPLFSLPVVGFLIKKLGALPVYRKQDDPTQMAKNAGTLDAAADALVAGRCITLFPEGKSHSEPQLLELKTGAARIALAAAQKGAKVRIVPLGLTYSDKGRFKSQVHVEVGAPVEVSPSDEVRALTQTVFEGLRGVTLNLGEWEDLPLLQTAEALYALPVGEAPKDPARLKAFARGMQLLRDEQPERFARLKSEVLALRRRLELVQAAPEDLGVTYRAAGVTRFVLRNLLALVTLPVFLFGMGLFAVPYWFPPAVVRVFGVAKDIEATIKVMLLFFVAPLWLLVVSAAAFFWGGPVAAAVALAGTLPLALYTRYWLERRSDAWHDARTFFVLGSRAGFKRRLLAEGEAVAKELESLAEELRPRLAG